MPSSWGMLMPPLSPGETMMYTVVERKGWSYVIGGPKADGAPWRYKWEAQEYADKLNAEARCDKTKDMFER